MFIFGDSCSGEERLLCGGEIGVPRNTKSVKQIFKLLAVEVHKFRLCIFVREPILYILILKSAKYSRFLLKCIISKIILLSLFKLDT